MKKLKVELRQCEVGKFNMLSDNESLTVIVILKDEEGKIVEENGERAYLYYSGYPSEQQEFEDSFPNNLDFIFEKAFSYARRVISSTNYEKRCLVFMKLYRDNFVSISEEYAERKRKEIETRIEHLKQELLSLDKISNCSSEMLSPIENRVSTYERWIKEEEATLVDLVENSDSWKKSHAKINGYKEKIQEIKKYLE